ncbi:type 4a pilus biogenesis protein PilO [Bremerella cremea]|uniref:type 4a pilus biogenesis protein PilO n=1 Tax=Bremerella cremea TaxID=1031537 RepID=UPI0031F0A51A
MKMPKSSTPWLVAGLCLVAAFAVLVYLPISRSISAKRDALNLKLSLVGQEQSLLAQIDKYQAEVEEVQAFSSTWPEVTNVNFELSQLLGEVSTQAKQSGADSLRLEPGQIESLQALQRIPVRLGCKGTFQEIHDLIRRIETMPQQIWVERIELAPSDDTNHELSCEVEFEAFMVSVKNSH